MSPNGCQSLLVTWTHRAPRPPLTLNHYRVEFQPQGGSQQIVTTTSQSSCTLTGLAPATTYTVRVRAQTQLGSGFVCCVPTATTPNGEATFDACMGSQGDRGTLLSINVTAMFLVYSMNSICAGVGQFNSYVILHQLLSVPRSKDLIGACSDRLYTTVRKL